MSALSPLEGLRVVELASFVAAPSAGAHLADPGADFVKVEVPRGEIYRHATPKWMGLRSDFPEAPQFQMDNGGKRSIALAGGWARRPGDRGSVGLKGSRVAADG